MTYDLDKGDLDTWRYWNLPEQAVDARASADDLIDEVESLLEDSVRLRLIADVPVGILLSGGIDSSLVTAMAARVSSQPMKTFTISFPGHGALDEGPYARIVAEHFATDHTELAAEATTYELLPELARQYDEPMADASLVPTYLVSHLVRQYAKVALGGDGGDELFGGYPHHNWILWQDRARRLIPRPLRRLLSRGAARWLPPGVKGRNHLIGFGSDLAFSIAHVNLFFDAATRRRLLVPDGFLHDESYVPPEFFKAALCDGGLSPLQQVTRVDFQTTMVDAYLVKADRATMMNGLEIRAPLLDHRLIELAFARLPDALRVTAFERRILSRRLAERLLPKSLDLKRKQGFTLPLATWFKGAWGRYVESVLAEADPSLFNQDVIRRLIAGQRRGYANVDRLFALTMFELWRREYRVAIAG